MSRKREGPVGEASSKEPPLPSPEEGTILCIVTRILGANYLIIRCQDGVERKARIPGSMRRRVWVKEGDIVLAAPWDFKGDRADIVYRYGRDEVRKLVEKGLLSREFAEEGGSSA